MPSWNRSNARHVLMRLALGFVLGWFGVQELHNPGDWAVFVPGLIADRMPGALENLVILHGFLLLTAGALVVFGMFCTGGALLAAAMLGEVSIGLWMDGGLNDLVIRDIGLFGLAAALALDPVRVWHLDDVIAAKWQAAQRPAKKKKGRPAPEARRPAWAVRVASGGTLIVALLLLAIVLRANGSGGGALPSAVAGMGAASPDAAQPTPDAAQPTPDTAQPTPDAAPSTPNAAQPTPAQAVSTGILFETWKYRRDAFQVYPGVVSADAKDALSGFDLTVQDNGAQVVLMFKALESRYHDATVTVDKGNTAYFIETTMRDDPNGGERDLGDDGVVMVSPDGYIVKS